MTSATPLSTRRRAAGAAALAVLLAVATGAGGRAFAAPAAATPAPAAAAAPAPAAAETAATSTVKIDNFSFGPHSIEVAVGATVTWVNHDDIPHNVVSTTQEFKSKVLDTDETFSHTFTKPGKYPYFCGLHPKMTGEVVVK